MRIQRGGGRGEIKRKRNGSFYKVTVKERIFVKMGVVACEGEQSKVFKDCFSHTHLLVCED